MVRRHASRPSELAGMSLAVVTLLLAAACGGGASSSGATSNSAEDLAHESLSQACAAGAKEGEVIIRRGSDADVFAKEIKPFEKKHPDIDVKYASLKPSKNTQQILAHAQTGQELNIDATDFELPTASPLLKRDLVARVDWKALGVSDELLAKTPSGVVVPRTDIRLLGITYDPKKVSASELPSTWRGLVNPKWAANKVVVDPRGKYLAPLAIAWGKQKAVKWYGDLLKTDKPLVVQGSTDSLQKVISGEALMSLSAHDSEVGEQKASGASVAIKYLDVVPATVEYAYIFKDAPHPNAARCFYGWRLSKQGRQRILKYEYKVDKLPPNVSPDRVSEVTSPKEGTLVTQVTQKFAQMTKVQ